MVLAYRSGDSAQELCGGALSAGVAYTMRELDRTTIAGCSAPDVATPLPSAKRSTAAKTRRRKMLRAFYWGMRCGGGPPGLSEAGIEEDAGPDDGDARGDQEKPVLQHKHALC